jgi:regulator of protease activity HflC (stomatin/prohibitin superfamily)
MIIEMLLISLGVIVVLYMLAGIRIVRPTERAVKETLGKYAGFAKYGFNWIFPGFQRLIQVNITEQMAEIDSQEMITEDKLNANVDLVVFYKVKEDEQSIKNALYKVNNFQRQIVILAQTTGRNVIGGMLFKDVNAERNQLNKQLAEIMKTETKSWGVEIVRVELKEIIPPKDVQDTMNKVIKAENEKRAAIDFATAAETQADGIKRAAIKEAEGIAQGRRIVADANAYKIKIENEAARKYFKAEAIKLKQLEVAQESLKNNSKIILGADTKGILKLFDLNK